MAASAYSYFTVLLVFLSFELNSSSPPKLNPFTKEVCESAPKEDKELCTNRLSGVECLDKRSLVKNELNVTHGYAENSVKLAKHVVEMKKRTNSINTKAAEECVVKLTGVAKIINGTFPFIEFEKYKVADERIKSCYADVTECLVSYKVVKNPLDLAIKLLLQSMDMVAIVIAHSKKE